MPASLLGQDLILFRRRKPLFPFKKLKELNEIKWEKEFLLYISNDSKWFNINTELVNITGRVGKIA